jgi:hypothetical protein
LGFLLPKFLIFKIGFLVVPNDVETLQQQGAILRFEYHRKQQRKKFPKARCCEP